MMKNKILPAGSTIGILGGGQLGRMLALAAARLGMKTHILCPDPNSPAFEVTPYKTVADYNDKSALKAFAEQVDIVTYEFENVPSETAAYLAQIKPLRPGPKALEISQDRVLEKQFLQDTAIPIASFQPINSQDDLKSAISQIGLPAVLKTTLMGYDGKGQRMLKSDADIAPAYEQLSGHALVLEDFISFAREISVIVARNLNGETLAFEPAENVHKNHILKTSTIPAQISDETAQKAIDIAQKIANALEYVGVLGVEFFVVEQGNNTQLLVNEIAPRVHNSGHWTEAVCRTDQFEQHIRAIANWPLGDPSAMADVVMENLIGDEISQLPEGITAGMQPHHYGKSEARAGRKMGHINHIGASRR